jgi:hypothetical protein
MEEQLAKLDLFKPRVDIERKKNCAPAGNCKKLENAKGRPESARPVYSQIGSSGLAPAPERFPSGARPAATSPSGRL